MKTWGRSRSHQRGFVMLVVIIIVALLALMGGLSAWLLRWAHRQGWW